MRSLPTIHVAVLLQPLALFSDGTGSVSYKDALAAIFIEGWIFIILSITGARQYLIRLLPRTLALSMSAGGLSATSLPLLRPQPAVKYCTCKIIIVSSKQTTVLEIRAQDLFCCRYWYVPGIHRLPGLGGYWLGHSRWCHAFNPW